MPNSEPDKFFAFSNTGFALFSLTPQYPIRLQSYDGHTYIYYSDCCEPDNHVGLIYSDQRLTEGCDEGSPEDAFPYPVPTTPGSTPSTPSTPSSPGGSTSSTAISALMISFHSSFSNVVAGKFNHAGRTVYPDYYSSGLTAFGIQDKNSLVRWFTITRLKFNMTSDGGANFAFEFPILLQSRPNQTIQYTDGTSEDPVNSWLLPSKVFLDWTTDQFGQVTLFIPNSDFSALEFVTCYLINRFR